MNTPKNMNELTELAGAVLAGDYKGPVDTKPDLTLMDRCDQCGSQAYVIAEFGDSSLLFCGHHAQKNWAGLESTATQIHDFRERLTADAAPR